eukprot:COSAG01_NODE_5823_length_4011_cov_3.745399_1_plen_67_part_00
MTAMQQGQLYLENASGITITGCELLAAGQSSVWMQGLAQVIKSISLPSLSVCSQPPPPLHVDTGLQ